MKRYLRYLLILIAFLMLSPFVYAGPEVTGGSFDPASPGEIGGTTPADATFNDVTLSAAKHLLLPLHNDAVTPTLGFGDGNSGFYEKQDNELRVALDGIAQYHFSTSWFGSTASNSSRMVRGAPTSTTPGFIPNNNDTDTGIGYAGADQLSLIAGGVEGIRIVEDTYIAVHFPETTTPTAIANYGAFYTKSDNKLYFQDGAGTEHVVNIGASGIKHEFHMPFEDPTGAVGNWDVVEIGTSQDTHFVLQISESFETLVNAKVVMIPDTTETIQWDINVSVAAAGEAYNNDDRSAVNQQLAVTADQLTEVDISGQLTGLVAGDYVAIDFQSDTANLRIIGFEFDYT